ncbi:MAG: hypothetical protein HC902_05435 [Calothrix sp. SM1_5_4]|nr:hypothetical protein [Calothrix sp. SM1_5_4]
MSVSPVLGYFLEFLFSALMGAQPNVAAGSAHRLSSDDLERFSRLTCSELVKAAQAEIARANWSAMAADLAPWGMPNLRLISLRTNSSPPGELDILLLPWKSWQPSPRTTKRPHLARPRRPLLTRRRRQPGDGNRDDAREAPDDGQPKDACAN